MKKQNLRSEAAIKRFIKEKRHKIAFLTDNDIIALELVTTNGVLVVAEIDLRDLIKKRKPLTGIKKQMSEIVNGKKKVKK